MPKWGDLEIGKERENAVNAQLVEMIRKKGFLGARFERIFDIYRGGRKTICKPDVSFPDGGMHIVSGKWGATKEMRAYSSAHEYQVDLSGHVSLGEVFAVTYPASKKEKFHLHVLPTKIHPEIPFTLSSLEEVADHIVEIAQGRIEELARLAEPVEEEASRLLLAGSRHLAAQLEGVPDRHLERIFGGHDFFQSVLAMKIKGAKRSGVLRLGTAALFVNQVLFYILLSRAAKGARRGEEYPPIDAQHMDSPEALRDHYFARVHRKDYEPIYGFDVAGFFNSDEAKEACRDLVRAVNGLAPKLDVPSLVGRLFQGLMPLAIRKPLGAHYTNPKAAALLARLAVEDASSTVLDPACGSGTLLVASYQRKLQLSRKRGALKLHRTFVQEHLTGMDAMAFSGHLAAVNLALQQPLEETDYVRIATADSTIRHPSDVITAASEALPHEFLQSRLDDNHERRERKKKRGPVRLQKGQERLIELRKVDLVIMNPPFTSWDHMAKSYRENLKKRFANEKAEYRDALFWKFSQQAPFILLADRFLKKGGTLATVLPFTTFTGRAFQPLIRFLLKNYTIAEIIVGLGRSSFSEDTSLTELLLVAKKNPPPSLDQTFRLIGTKKVPDTWTDEDIEAIASQTEQGMISEELAAVRHFPLKSLLPENETLPALVFRFIEEYERACELIDDLYEHADMPIIRVKQLRDNTGIVLTRWVLGSEHLSHYGSKALFAVRSEERALKAIDRLVWHKETEDFVEFRDRVGGKIYRYSKEDIVPALRRFSYLKGLDVTDQTDFAVAHPTPILEEALTDFYGKEDARMHLSRIKKRTKRYKGGRWPARVVQGSARVNIAARLNLAAPGTSVIVCRTNEPTFLATYGYMAKNFDNDNHEKLFTLWINSSMALLNLIGRMTVTEGTWVRIEEYVMNRLLIPDFSKVSKRKWQLVVRLYEELRGLAWPSLVEQLKGHETRKRLDDVLLELLGVSDAKERETIAECIRQGILFALESLAKTMGKGIPA